MSVTVTRDTLGRNAVFFIVEVLRNNLTDTQSPVRVDNKWILKSQDSTPIDKTDSLPKIVLDVDTINYRTLDVDGSMQVPDTISIDCDIYIDGSTPDAMAKRDEYCDLIRTTLFNGDSVDADGTKLKENYLILRSFREEVADFHTAHPKIVRCKRIGMEFRYCGG